MPPRSLLGREAELTVARAVHERAAIGRGSVLVVVGEPGIGKTAFLDAIAETPGRRVVRATGVEAESAMAFATLQGLLWPLRDNLDQLDSGQARLLRGVMELGHVESATTFAVGAAALALFSVSSRDAPLMLVVDDMQWADIASQEVLAFVGRRLGSERVAMFAGVREGESTLLPEERSFRRLELRGLPPNEARALLDERIKPQVAEVLLEVCAGNPLGLLELPRGLTDGQLRGDEPLPEVIEVGPSIQRTFAARAAGLGAAQQRALLLVAANGRADTALLARLGAAAATIDAIKASGLVAERAGSIAYRHPLMQAAVYSAAPAEERRAAHADLASATEGARRAWHLAAGASGPDEQVAASMVAITAQVRAAGGLAAEAQALERAAELTPDAELRARRMLAAAQAWRRAGRLNHGFAISERALELARTVRTRAELQLERGSFLIRSDEPEAARVMLMAEAERAAPVEPKLAAQILVKAAYPSAAIFDVKSAMAVANRALALAGHEGDRAELEALNAVLEHRTENGEPPDATDLQLAARAEELLGNPELRAGAEEQHWIAYCLALFESDDPARRLSDTGLAETRASGDVWNLCFALYARAAIEQVTGRLDLARPYAIEALALALDIGETYRFNEASAVMAEVDAARGAREDALRVHDARRGIAERDPHIVFYRSQLRAWICMARGEFAEAISHLELAVPDIRSGPARAWYSLLPLELADAYLSAGRRGDAEAQLREVGPEIEGSPLLRPKAKLARVRAFAAAEGHYDAMFGATLSMLDRMPQAFDRARTELAWGERLDRSKRASEAATHMERALAHFEALGAVGWADRTRGQLEVMTGQRHKAQPRRTDVLSAQELRIAQRAAAGMRDREIAATLYLSPRTVESYLQSAYRKLDVSNRTQLAAVLAGDGISTQSAVIPR